MRATLFLLVISKFSLRNKFFHRVKCLETLSYKEKTTPDIFERELIGFPIDVPKDFRTCSDVNEVGN